MKAYIMFIQDKQKGSKMELKHVFLKEHISKCVLVSILSNCADEFQIDKLFFENNLSKEAFQDFWKYSREYSKTLKFWSKDQNYIHILECNKILNQHFDSIKNKSTLPLEEWVEKMEHILISENKSEIDDLALSISEIASEENKLALRLTALEKIRHALYLIK